MKAYCPICGRRGKVVIGKVGVLPHGADKRVSFDGGSIKNCRGCGATTVFSVGKVPA